MGSMMTGLYVGLSGLRTSSNSLNTTSNNLTNVNTDGYVRQQVINKDVMYYDVTCSSGMGQAGLGVTVSKINHVRDIFLDDAYRRENGRAGFYEKLHDAVSEIETQLGNTDGIDGIQFQQNITSLYEAVNKVVEAPGELVNRSALVQSAVEFIDKAQLVYGGLKKYQNTLNDEVNSVVNRINEIGHKVQDLNVRISKVEAGQVEGANDLRDQRDMLLDELSKYGKIKTNEDNRGVVEVSFEGVPFVDDLSVNELGVKFNDDSSFIIPIWPQMGDQEVFNITTDISTESNTDIGSLKGLLIARGNYSPIYSDVDTASVDYNTSVVFKTMANLDKLVNSIVESINDIFCPEKTYTAADGSVYTVLDTDIAPMAKDGTYGVELFTRAYTDRYTVQTIDGQQMYVRNNTNTFGNNSTYNINNISVNDVILKDYSKMALTRADGADAFDVAKQLAHIFSPDTQNDVGEKYLMTYDLGDSNVITRLSFEKFYEAITSDVATTGKIYRSMADNEDTLAHSIDNKRQEIMGVQSDEELGNMIKYQQAYNAASRYINVVAEMIDTLINKVGG